MNAQSQPVPERVVGRPLGSVGARGRRQQLILAYIELLGGKARVTAIQRQDVERAVDLVGLAKTARAALAAGKSSIDDVVKLENAADRAVRRLNLPVPGRSKSALKYGRPEPEPTLQDYLAGQHGEEK